MSDDGEYVEYGDFSENEYEEYVTVQNEVGSSISHQTSNRKKFSVLFIVYRRTMKLSVPIIIVIVALALVISPFLASLVDSKQPFPEITETTSFPVPISSAQAPATSTTTTTTTVTPTTTTATTTTTTTATTPTTTTATTPTTTTATSNLFAVLILHAQSRNESLYRISGHYKC